MQLYSKRRECTKSIKHRIFCSESIFCVISWLQKVLELLTKEINLRIAPSWLYIHSHGSNPESPPPPSMLTSNRSSERRLNTNGSFLQQRCVLFATKCDFCSARLINKVNTRGQQNTSVFRQTARPINTKILGNRVERSGPKHKAPRTVLGTIPDDVNYACMKCLPLLCHGRWPGDPFILLRFKVFSTLAKLISRPVV